MIPGEWAERGLCAEIGGDVWYPELDQSNKTGKQVCARCEVIAQCREYAIRTRQTDGIWGGLSTRERMKLWRTA